MARPFFVRRRRKGLQSRKVCPICVDKTVTVDWKNPALLKRFITERGKMVPRRISGVCSRHQRQITLAIKRARHIALLPFSTGSTP